MQLKNIRVMPRITHTAIAAILSVAPLAIASAQGEGSLDELIGDVETIPVDNEAEAQAAADAEALAAAAAADAEAKRALVEEIVIVGSRRPPRSAADTVAPVDVISASTIADQAPSDISDLMRVAVPSYNVNAQPISDAATIIRPANLRGLSPDNTLVLLNGKRRHRASVISFLGGGIADGAHGPDVSVFPAIGLKQVEVLRDGASSQYGSDAIAGVINFVLRDDREGATLEAKYGSTYQGDGENFRLGGNIGFPLGASGFINISAETLGTEPTDRSVQRDDAAALIAAGNTDVQDIRVNTITTEHVQIWGSPEVKDDHKLFINSAIPFSNSVEGYAFGNYATREVDGGFFFRNPTNRGGVYAGPLVNPANGDADPNGVPSVLVGDLSIQDTDDCPDGIPLTGQDGLIPDPTIRAQVEADDNCWSFIELFPGGFVPRFGGKTEDLAGVIGLRGELSVGNGLNYDFSYSYGDNKTDFFIRNTINASLGPDTPTSFFPGAYRQTDNNFNLDLSYGLPVRGLASDLYISWGFEHRTERFEITQGELASRQIGILAQPGGAYPVGQGFSSSSNGFGGFTVATSNEESNSAVYLELEADVTDSLTLQTAGRYESFENFGSTFDYKIGGLFTVSPDLRLRGTYSTGFHVPTAGQANVVNTTTQFVGSVLTDVGTIPLKTAAGQFVNQRRAARGEAPFELGPEEATNFSLGVSFDVGNATITMDYFDIALDGRIATTSDIDFLGELRAFAMENGVETYDDQNMNGMQDQGEPDYTTSQQINALDGTQGFRAADYAGFEDLAVFRVFTNNFDTRTRGVDLVAGIPVDLGVGSSDLALAMNYTITDVVNAGKFAPLDPLRIQQLEKNIPRTKGSLTFNHSQGRWRAMTRLNFHSRYFEGHLDSFPVDLKGQQTLDVEVTATFMDMLDVSLGAANVFDSYPEELDPSLAGVAGARYPTTAPFGFNGGQYYLRLRSNFF